MSTQQNDPLKKQKARVRPVRLRIPTLMVQQDPPIRSITSLWKIVADMGVVISRSQLSRIVNNQADMLDKRLLSVLAAIFDCSVKDLFDD